MRGLTILNGFGRSLGDGIIGLQALSLAIEEGTITDTPVLARLPNLPRPLQELYTLASDMARVEPLDWKYEQRGQLPDFCVDYANVIDLRDFAFDPAFRGTSMIDFFLRNLDLDPHAITSARKRNRWLAARLPLRRGHRDEGYVLLCPSASMRLRCMPQPVHDAILAWIEDNLGLPVWSQLVLPPEATFAGICRLVASAAFVISTDTSMVHLADAFSVPCLAFFPTHRPEWRSRDYPLCRSIFLSADLPPALEFSRGAADIAAADAAWLPDGADLGWLSTILSQTASDFGLRRRLTRRDGARAG
jgi:hypothetical protein